VRINEFIYFYTYVCLHRSNPSIGMVSSRLSERDERGKERERGIRVAMHDEMHDNDVVHGTVLFLIFPS